jgi:drug/metabolite transporter (DMT)-like permease
MAFKFKFTGAQLAILATLLWSGNFIVARAVSHQIPPVTLAFLRWACASAILFPAAAKAIKVNGPSLRGSMGQLLLASFTGIALFNTLLYMAAKYSTATNMALIGTTSSPIFSFLLAAMVLKEKLPLNRIAGLWIGVAGILLLLSKGDAKVLMQFRFSQGDWLILSAAFSFACYNIITRKRKLSLPGTQYLSIIFLLGTCMLFPFSLAEWWVYKKPITLPLLPLLGVVVYLGVCASVLAFLFWNRALAKLGAAKASIFGNLIPVFSTVEAAILLQEKISGIQIISMLVILLGLLLANNPMSWQGIQWKKHMRS